MVYDIGIRIKEELERQELHLNFDSSNNSYKPWYKIPFNVNFPKKVWPRGMAQKNIGAIGNVYT